MLKKMLFFLGLGALLTAITVVLPLKPEGLSWHASTVAARPIDFNSLKAARSVSSLAVNRPGRLKLRLRSLSLQAAGQPDEAVR